MMENRVLTLVKVISALFFDRIATDDVAEVRDEVRDTLSTIKIDHRSSGIGNEEGMVEALKHTAEWMMEADDEVRFSRDNIVQRLTMNVNGDNYYISFIHDILDDKIGQEDARQRVVEILSELRYDAKQNQIRKLILDANKALNFGGSDVDPAKYAMDLTIKLNEHAQAGKGQAPGLIGLLNFDNETEIEAALARTADGYSTEGILKTGFVGWDMSTGCGGYRRGEFINHAGLTHMYKSGKLLDDALFIPQFNEPYMWDDNKKPLIVRISFENTIQQDVGNLYKKLFEIKNQKRLDRAEINLMKAKKEIIRHFGQNGYHFRLYSFDPNNFCIYDLFNLFQKLIQEGYEIHLADIDYLGLITHNTPGDRLDTKIQRTIEMTRNFCYPKGITVSNAHQLSTQAQELARENPNTFTKKVNSGGYYMDCKSFHTKLDLEYVQHIIDHVDGNRYLMVSRGKHRGGEDTPMTHCHFVYKFQEFGGIVPDYDNPELLMRKLPSTNNVDDLFGEGGLLT